MRDRQVWDFALVNIAAVDQHVGLDDQRRAHGGQRRGGDAVPPRPRSKRSIKGKARDKATADQAADMAVQGAAPLRHNAYKIPLMKALVKRAIRGDAEWQPLNDGPQPMG